MEWSAYFIGSSDLIATVALDSPPIHVHSGPLLFAYSTDCTRVLPVGSSFGLHFIKFGIHRYNINISFIIV